MNKMTAKDFLLLHSDAEGDECIEWPFGRNAKGYGYCRFGPERGSAHRLMCALAHGPAPFSGAEAAHSCGNPGCVNPRHLRWASSYENHQDRIVHGTTNRGEKCPMGKLNPDQVREIRRRYDAGESTGAIGREFGVHRHSIRSIGKRKNWGWLED